VISAGKVNLELSLTTPRSPFLTWVQAGREYSPSRSTALPLLKNTQYAMYKEPVVTVIQSGRFGKYENLLTPPTMEDQTSSSKLYRMAIPENWTEGTADSYRGSYGSSTIQCDKQLALISSTLKIEEQYIT